MTALAHADSPGFVSALLHRLSVWRTILTISVAERLVYRGDFMLGTLMRFLPIVTQIFLWTAVFAGQGGIKLGGYSKDDIIAYYLLTMVARAFSSMPGHAGAIARSIRDGSVKKFLTQPVDWLEFLFLTRVAHKLVYYAVALLPFALVFYLCRDYFPPLPDAGTWLAFLASLAMSFLLGFYMEAAIGMIGFWFLEVSSLLFVYMLFNFFLSGHMFPLTLLDGVDLFAGVNLGDVVRALPFQYLAYFPAAVFLGKVEGPELTQGLLMELAWVVGFIVLSRVWYARGIKRYAAFGG
ncbi:MAG: ABC-2 family transporter protein [Pirellulales bacterium]